MVELFVTLKSSDNDLIKYPCRGWIELFEISIDGSLIKSVFRILKSDGSSSAPVVIDNPVFEFNNKDALYRQNGDGR